MASAIPSSSPVVAANAHQDSDISSEKTNGHIDHITLNNVDSVNDVHGEPPEEAPKRGSAASTREEVVKVDIHKDHSTHTPHKPEQLDLPHHDQQEAIDESAPTPTPAPLAIPPSEPATSPLDALLSPKSPDGTFEARQSVAASDITDDDGRFSTVLLSARQSLDTDTLSLNGSIDPSSSSTLADEDAEHDGRRDTLSKLDGSELIRMVHTNRQHKKTASTSTIVSASNVPFLLARLDVQNDETEEGSNRRSLDGQQKLQEDFNRMQMESEPQPDVAVVGAVDWGECYYCVACVKH